MKVKGIYALMLMFLIYLKFKTDANSTVSDLMRSSLNCSVNPNVYGIDCSRLGFWSGPVFRNRNTRILNLGRNELQIIRKNVFLYLSELRELNLEFNKIFKIADGAFNGLNGITKLILSGNRLNHLSFNSTIFNSISHLKHLEIRSNLFVFDDRHVLEISLSHLYNLEYLSLSIYQGLNFKKLGNLTKLTYLKVARFATLNNDTFTGFAPWSVKYLEIEANIIHKGAFSPFRNLKGLDIYGHENILQVLESLMPLQNMSFEYLRLGGNYAVGQRPVTLTSYKVRYLANICTPELSLAEDFIEEIEHSAISGLRYKSCIRSLYLHGNRFSNAVMTVAISEFDNLEYLQVCCLLAFKPHYPLIKYTILDNSVESKIKMYQKVKTSMRKTKYTSQEGEKHKDQRNLKILAKRNFRSALKNKSQSKKEWISQFLHTNERKNLVYHEMQSRLYLYVDKKLKFINASYLPLDASDTGNITLVNGQNIELLDFGFSTFSSCSGIWRGLPNLKTFNMSRFNCSVLNTNLLHYFPKLKTFVAVKANLGKGFKHDKAGVFFKDLHMLESINLAENGLSEFHPNLFLDQNVSLLNLILYGNNFVSIPVNFTIFQNLKFLDLSRNLLINLGSIDRNLITTYVSQNEDLVLYLAGNKLQCTCDDMEFLKWLQKSKRYIDDFNILKCMSSVHDTQNVSDILTSLPKFEEQCISMFWLVFSVCAFTVLCLIIVLSIIGYKNRIAIEYICLKMRWFLNNYKPIEIEYQYDAFIAYSNSDTNWVVHKLRKFLEDDNNLKVCFYGRDFIPSNTLGDEIYNAIKRSRKIIFVLTRCFLESEWIIYEFEQARMHMFQKYRENNIIIIFKENIASKELPQIVRTIRQRVIYLEYPFKEEQEEINVFWKKLKKAFKRRQVQVQNQRTVGELQME